MKKIILLILGIIFSVLGIIGCILPVIPQVPFFIIAVICFMYSSPRLFLWFKKTRFYQIYLADCVEKRGLKRKNKVIYIVSFTIPMLVCILLLWDRLYVSITLGVLWLIYVLFILFGLKNLD